MIGKRSRHPAEGNPGEALNGAHLEHRPTFQRSAYALSRVAISLNEEDLTASGIKGFPTRSL
jgi:hypothetical protein